MDNQSRKINVYRTIEKFILGAFIILVVIISQTVLPVDLTPGQTIFGISVSLILLLSIFVIQHLVDKQIKLTMGQTNYAEEDIFNALYQRSPVAYILLDNREKITRANPAAIKLLKAQTDKISSVDLFSLIDLKEESVTVLKSRIADSQTINDKEVPLKNLENENVWVMLSAYPYRNTGENLVSMVNVTEQKNIDTAKTEFVALATHQLRTPISAIRWNMELLTRSLKPDQTEDQLRYSEKINRNILRMIDLINDFLSVSKLEMGTYAGKLTEINLTEFFNNIVDEFSSKITEKSLVVNISGDPENKIIKIDDRLIHIIVSNLVSNAVKYLKTDGELQITYNVSNKNTKIIITDNGIGIPETELDKLFTKFYRASNAQAHNTQGTGLGLYIVKESVKQLGGKINVESGENQGATFIIDIPIT